MPIGLKSPDWQCEQHDWPYAEHSRFVETRSHLWHVQRMGAGPQVLLIHGTGASTHSFADLLPELASRFDVMALDLPGHGFTRTNGLYPATPRRVVEDIGYLLATEAFAPRIIVGHSAGAVIASCLGAMDVSDPALVVALNGAFRPFGGVARVIAPVMAKALYFNPLTSHAFAWSARNEERVRNLIAQTGSSIPERNIMFYQRLFQYPGHISGALGLMANWDLEGIEEQISQLRTPHLFLVGIDDRAVPPSNSERLAEVMSNAALVRLTGRGHLVHEEDPVAIAGHIRTAASEHGVL